MSTIAKIVSFFAMFIVNYAFAQEKETIIISFESNSCNIKHIDSTGIYFNFICEKNTKHTLYFICDNSAIKEKVVYKKIKKKLITSSQAIDKVELYLAGKAKLCKQENKGVDEACELIRNPPAFNYNSYFDAIYIYENTGKGGGVLYKVDWQYFIID